jgi:hypothetical protein
MSVFSVLTSGVSFAAVVGVPTDIETNIINSPTLDYSIGNGDICKTEIKDAAGNLLARQTLGIQDGISYSGNPPGNAAALSIVESEKSGIVIGYEASIFKEHFWSDKQIHATIYIYRRIGTDQDPDGRGFLNKVDGEMPAGKSADGSTLYYGEIIESNDTLLGTLSLVGDGSKTQQIEKYSVTTSCDAVKGNG